MTNTNDQISPFEPTIFGSIWSHRFVVVIVIASFGVLGLLASGLQPLSKQWIATATLVIEDPVQSTLFEREGQQPGRYVNDQVAILHSTPVADEASRLLSTGTPPIFIEAADILEATEISQDANSNVVHVMFSADDERAAISGANAITGAYQQVRRSEVARGFQASLDQLDASIAESEAEIASLQEAIDVLRSGAVDRDQLDAQFADAVDRLASLQGTAASASPEALPAIQQEIEILVQELQALQLAMAVGAEPSGQDVLLQEQAKAIDRKSSLTARRDQLEVDLQLLGSGVLVESPAIAAEPPGSPSYIRNGILALLLGIPIAVGVAYLRALRRRTFTARSEPEIVLHVPLLAQIPEFKDERLTTALPVWDAPQSEAAEGFRFNARGPRSPHRFHASPQRSRSHRRHVTGLRRSECRGRQDRHGGQYGSRGGIGGGSACPGHRRRYRGSRALRAPRDAFQRARETRSGAPRGRGSNDRGTLAQRWISPSAPSGRFPQSIDQLLLVARGPQAAAEPGDSLRPGAGRPAPAPPSRLLQHSGELPGRCGRDRPVRFPGDRDRGSHEPRRTDRNTNHRIRVQSGTASP